MTKKFRKKINFNLKKIKILKPYLTDRFAFAQQQPAIDPVDRQDIFDIGGALIDDIQVNKENCLGPLTKDFIKSVLFSMDLWVLITNKNIRLK